MQHARIVVGGMEAGAGTWPWQVALLEPQGSGFRQFCGGSVIHERWVLAAAHCVDGVDADEIQVLVGAHDLDGGGRRTAVKTIRVHGSFFQDMLGRPLWWPDPVRGCDLATPRQRGSRDDGITSLHVAALLGALYRARLLIDRGVDVNAVNSHGATPLHYAAGSDALDVARLLVDRGADIDAGDGEWFSCTDIEAGADDWRYRPVIDATGRMTGDTPLHVAAWNNALGVAKLLIDRGAEVNVVAMDGNKRLVFEMPGGHPEPKYDVLDVSRWLSGSGLGLTPLDVAVGWGNREVEALLRRHGGQCAREC